MRLRRGLLNLCAISLLGFTILMICIVPFNDDLYPDGKIKDFIMEPKNFSSSVHTSLVMSDGIYIYQLNMSPFKAEFPYAQSYQCRLIRDRPGFCQTTGKNFLLLLATKSHPASIERRKAIRQTWAMDHEIPPFMVKHVFLMAYSLDLAEMQQVVEENAQYEDILLWDFIESHNNLSLKERCFIEWLHNNCKEAKFIFKGDDDEFVNPKAVVKYLTATANATTAVHGYMRKGSDSVREGKYKVTKAMYPSERYPMFPSGGGYIIPGAYIASLYLATTWMPLFPLDDVYFGFLGLAAQVTYRHDYRFFVYGKSYNRCAYQKALVVHGTSPQELNYIWLDLQKEDTCRPKNFIPFVLLIFIVLCALG